MSLSIQNNSLSSYSSQPLSSTLIQALGDKAKHNVVPSQQDPSLITPEDVNRAIRSAEVSLSHASEQQQAQADAKRSALVGLNGAQHQQQMIDVYLQVASDGEYSASPSVSSSAALDILDQAQQGAQINKVIELAQDRDQELLKPIQPLPEDGASIQPMPASIISYGSIQASSEQHLGLGLSISA